MTSPLARDNIWAGGLIMKKIVQALYVGIAAYNLYIAVDKFLETPQGKSLKKKAKPVIKKAKEKIDEVIEKVTE